jgi:hypothetical protein
MVPPIAQVNSLSCRLRLPLITELGILNWTEGSYSDSMGAFINSGLGLNSFGLPSLLAKFLYTISKGSLKTSTTWLFSTINEMSEPCFCSAESGLVTQLEDFTLIMSFCLISFPP